MRAAPRMGACRPHPANHSETRLNPSSRLSVPSLGRFGAATLVALAILALLLLGGAASAHAAQLNLEGLSGTEAEEMLEDGELTSVQLTEAYLGRIDALNKAGPGLNAVTQINKEAIAEAEKADAERAMGIDLGPAMGLPILVKDIIDVKGMYTSAGDWALRESFPEKDSGVAKELKAHGLIILGKAGLSEWANSFGSQPSGFGNLTGQVLSAIDTAEGPSGSSSGSGAAAAASLAALTIGTETSGSIISPSTQQGDVGLRPTLGLVPGYGIAPILASQDTAGPIVRNVPDAAMTLQSIAEVTGTDTEANEEYEAIMGPEFLRNGDIQPAPFSKLPNYMSALTPGFVSGKRIGYNGTSEATLKAKEVLEKAGAILVLDEKTSANIPAEDALPAQYEEHATIDDYYKHLGAGVPVKSLAEEVAVDNANPQEAEKDGNKEHAKEVLAEAVFGGPNQQTYAANLPKRKAISHEAIEKMMEEPSGGGGPVIAVIGSVPGGPAAGDPEIAVPMGYTATQRRNTAVDVNGGAYDDRNLIGVSYVIEQGTHLRKPPAEVDPSAYRCAHTAKPELFAARGHCNPDYQSLMSTLGGTPKVLPFSLESTSAAELETMLKNGTLTSTELVKAELYRAALTNADGPSVQAIRAIAPGAIAAAEASDKLRAEGLATGALAGIPVLVEDSINVAGLATSAGSIALQNNVPATDATLVTKLKEQGAIILGDTNTTEFAGAMESTASSGTTPNMPRGYSSLGGQVLLPSDTNVTATASYAGSAGAVSMGLAPLAVGIETANETGQVEAQLIGPAGNAGLVGLKPTVGLVSTAGVLPVAKSQDAPGPIAQTVTDAAIELEALTGTTGTYTSGLTTTALNGKKLAVVTTKPEASQSATEKPYAAAETAAVADGATTTVVTPAAGTTVPSIVPYEFHRDLNAYLAEQPAPPAPLTAAKTLAEVIAYNTANPAEGLKFGQAGLTAAQAVETENVATKTTYEENLLNGRTQDRAVIDNILTAGPYGAIMVPSGSTLVGIADRAGYPVLTLPAGFGLKESGTGGDPIGIDLIGTGGSEAALLDYAYALEHSLQARKTGPAYMAVAGTKVSGTPSETNQSMFRCIVGSEFYKPYDCNPGEPGALSSVAIASEEQLPVEAPAPPVGSTGGGESKSPEGTSGTTPTAPVKIKVPGLKRDLDKGTVLLKVDVSGSGKLTLTGKGVKSVSVKVKKAGTVTVAVVAKGGLLKTLKAKGSAKVKVKIAFVATDGAKTTMVRTITLVKKK
jgi:amidase